MSENLPETKIDRQSTHVDIEQFLTFKLNDEIYGVNILQVREIIDFGRITKVPMMPESIAGVINLRGSVVPVVELACRFGSEPSERTNRSSILILEIEEDNEKFGVGITVDIVNEVVDLSVKDIEPTPSFGMQIRTDFISGMGKTESDLLIILNIENVLSVDELSIIDRSLTLN